MDILDKWYRSFNISDEESSRLLVKSIPTEEDFSKDFDEEIQSRFFSFIEGSGIKYPDYVVSYSYCATHIIDQLFSKYVDDDTLVLTTGSEHPSVTNNLRNCKHIEYVARGSSLNYKIINDLSLISKKYKKIFVYVCASPIFSLTSIPQEYLIKLKNTLVSIGVEHTFVLDDVQAMFLIQRNYEIFDYIIGTAHAAIPNFDLGIVISKKIPFAGFNKDLSSKHLDLLGIILSRKYQLMTFSYYMTEYYHWLRRYPNYFLMLNFIPYKFIIIDQPKNTYRDGILTSQLHIVGVDYTEEKKIMKGRDRTLLEYMDGPYRACKAASDYERFRNDIIRQDNLLRNLIETYEQLYSV